MGLVYELHLPKKSTVTWVDISYMVAMGWMNLVFSTTKLRAKPLGGRRFVLRASHVTLCRSRWLSQMVFMKQKLRWLRWFWGNFWPFCVHFFSAVAAVLWGTLGQTDKSEQKLHDPTFYKQKLFVRWQRTRFFQTTKCKMGPYQLEMGLKRI